MKGASADTSADNSTLNQALLLRCRKRGAHGVSLLSQRRSSQVVDIKAVRSCASTLMVHVTERLRSGPWSGPSDTSLTVSGLICCWCADIRDLVSLTRNCKTAFLSGCIKLTSYHQSRSSDPCRLRAFSNGRRHWTHTCDSCCGKTPL